MAGRLSLQPSNFKHGSKIGYDEEIFIVLYHDVYMALMYLFFRMFLLSPPCT